MHEKLEIYCQHKLRERKTGQKKSDTYNNYDSVTLTFHPSISQYVENETFTTFYKHLPGNVGNLLDIYWRVTK
ncbi:MAG: hypothetical protein OMM_14348 [Candidatus Magnetoglobus multicellularis str. Araruama]|uniref:Uncharacterized protein n=1 Tax=Candidatus Magnetoglobus multicellularis str. Araruama TaxID=890399 RepID=A0A1V1NS41_9BACT|nr:MAG: hypothetical protein OMM_14348 [Candidatus Magnetoglobus multicellularis str. Araruama]